MDGEFPAKIIEEFEEKLLATLQNDSEKTIKVKKILNKFQETNNIYIFSKILEVNLELLLLELKQIILGPQELKHVENLLIHFEDWNIQFSICTKLTNFDLSEMDEIIKNRFFRNFGNFNLILDRLINIENIFEVNKFLQMKNIQIYNKISTKDLLNYILTKKLKKNPKNLIFYVTLRLKDRFEVEILKSIFEKNNWQTCQIKKAMDSASQNHQKMIKKIFFKK